MLPYVIFIRYIRRHSINWNTLTLFVDDTAFRNSSSCPGLPWTICVCQVGTSELLKSIPKQTLQTKISQRKLQFIQIAILLKLPKAGYNLLTLTNLLTAPLVLFMENTILRNVVGMKDPERLVLELEIILSLNKSG